MEIEVQGHSGCQISISQENNTLFVLKGTNNISYIASRETKKLLTRRRFQNPDTQNILYCK